MQRHTVIGEPLRDIAHLVGIVIVKVLTRRENLDALETRSKDSVENV